MAPHRIGGAPAGALGKGAVIGSAVGVIARVPVNAAVVRPWAHFPRSRDTLWVLVMARDVPPALANEPLATFPPKEERDIYDWPCLLSEDPVNPTRYTPLDAATCDVGDQRITPPDEAGTEYRLAQVFTWGIDSDRRPVLNMIPA
jgi:hypothetical protein